MRKILVYLLSIIVSIILGFLLIFLGVKVYNSIYFMGNTSIVSSALVAVEFLIFIKAIRLITEKAAIFSTKERTLYERIKKKVPYWADVIISDNYVSINWKSLEKNIIHNYEFDFSQDRAKFYDSGDISRVTFEGSVKEAVSRLK